MLRTRTLGLTTTVFALLTLLVSPASATSYVMVADEDLADGADLIALVRITGHEVVEIDGRIYTDFLAETREVVKGAAAPVLRLRRPGGTLADGRSRIVFGMPELSPGQDALVFLEPEVDGAREFEHYLLGSFHVATVDGRTVAYRYVPTGDLMLQNAHRARHAASLRQAHKPRDLTGFMGWLRARTEETRAPEDPEAEVEPGDYYLDESILDRLPGSAFTLFEFGGSNFHRHEFSRSVKGSVEYVYNKRLKKTSRGGVKAFQATLASMSKIFNMDVTFGGKDRRATGGLTKTDGKNAVLTGDRTKEITGSYDCRTGGVLALGGIAAGGAVGPAHVAESSGRKRTYWDIRESDVVLQDGIECNRDFLSKKEWDSFLAELFGHEIFHSFGASHACGDDASGACKRKVHDEAIMRASIHGDGRGAAFNRDDKKAAKALDYKG